MASSLTVAMAALLGACTPSSNAANTAANTAQSESTAGGSTASAPDAAVAESAPDATVVESDDAAAPSAPVDAAPSVSFAGLRAVTVRPGARLPRTSSVRHGSTAWTVIVAAASGPTPALDTVFAQLNGLRLSGALGELTCSPIASGEYPESVPHGSGAMAVTLNFGSERDARAFASALTEQPLWIGRARVMCAD